MKSKKLLKLFSMTCALLLLVSMFGCAAPQPTKANEPAIANEPAVAEATKAPEAAATPPAEKIKLRVVSLSTDENQINIMENYIKKNLATALPNVEVEFEPGGGGDDYGNKMKTYSASGDLPDVWYSSAEFATAIINAGNQLDLTSAITADGFIKNFQVPEAMKFSDGKIYALSAGADTYFTPRIFYHKEIFEKYGLSEPKTFDEFMTLCQTLKKNKVVPLSVMGKGGWAPSLYMVQTMIQCEDPQVAQDLLANKTDFTNPVVLAALKKIERMAKEGVFPEGVANLDYGPSLEMFTSGKTAMFGGFTWEVPNLSKDSNIGMFMWPSSNTNYTSEDVTQFWGAPINGYAVNAKSEHLDMAVKLAEYCVSMEAQFYAEKGSKLNLKTNVDSGEPTPLMAENLSLYNNTKLKIPTIYLNAMDAKTSQEYGTYGANLLTGSYTAEEFVKDFNPIWLENSWFKK